GCCRTGDVHIYFGTSSWLISLIPERVSDFAPLYSIFDPDHDCAIFALQTGCFAFDWALSQFYHAERDILQGDIYEFVGKQINSIEAGSMNMIATHWMNGELPPLAAKNAKAVFFNVTSSHDRCHMVRAIMESVCYTHRRYKEKYESYTGKKLESIRVVGGGAVSDVWMQILADVLQTRICIPENPRLTGAMGAYYCAMIGLGYLKDYNAIYDTVKISKVFNPNKENVEVYNKLYNIYLNLYPSLSGLYDEINGVY
ncbi:MAG TPA: FGGY-family carbohydrate kinase, partial [Bacillota bacterium]|nr:FGGY-family carbohydrate kinase [Bacillota bacterium]